MKQLISKVKRYIVTTAQYIKDCISYGTEMITHRVNKWPVFTASLFVLGVAVGNLDVSLGLFTLVAYGALHLYKANK
jgi:hypothetical protein